MTIPSTAKGDGMTNWGNSFPGNAPFPADNTEGGEIPRDVMKAAWDAAGHVYDPENSPGSHRYVRDIFERAILAERKRAAATARSWGQTCRKVGQSEGADVAEDIALCIEEGK